MPRWLGTHPASVDLWRRLLSAADEYAALYLSAHPGTRLGLVAAASGAHALSAVGWQGPLNYDNDTGEFAAVVATWQVRFGAREHFAFCPDNVSQGTRPYTVAAYAEGLIGKRASTFWWD